jgi:hypothetical protein
VRLLPLLVVLVTLPAARAQESDEIEPIMGFEAQMAGMPGCHDDMCGRVPVPLSNAMLMAPGEWMMTVRVERRRYVGRWTATSPWAPARSSARASRWRRATWT